MLLLWAILFIIIAIVLGIFAFGGVAIAISFFTKILFVLSFSCFIVGLILLILEKIKVRERHPSKYDD